MKWGYYVWPLTFWMFVAGKLVSATFAAWSWWWVIFPLVPILGIVIEKLGV